MYVTDQPYFLNVVVMGKTTLPPHELLKALKAIEAEMGRDLTPAAQRYGPRPIDIDILLATKVLNPHDVDDYIVVNEPDLIIPHMRLTERAFVLYPLLDIAIDENMVYPILGKSPHDLREQVKEQDIRNLGLLDEARLASSKDDSSL